MIIVIIALMIIVLMILHNRPSLHVPLQHLVWGPEAGPQTIQHLQLFPVEDH